jgi:glycogen operon protein
MTDTRRAEAPRARTFPKRFTLFSRHAEAVELCLFDADGEAERERIPLRPDGSGHWRADVEAIRHGQLYGFRVHGPFDPQSGHRFNPAKMLVDPRAMAVNREPPLDDSFSGASPVDPMSPDPRDTAAIAPKSIVVDPTFDWSGDERPSVPWQDTVIYECHVRGTSLLHPDVPEELRGTYLGLASEPIIRHLRRLGVTTIELLPVQQIATEPHLLEHGLTNFFGYSPLALFAPHAAYARDSLGGQVAEFKQMVKVLHAHGIEVLLDVVFNHTAEGDHRGRTLSLRGIDNSSYYRLNREDPSRYRDFTGCGNTVAADDPEVARLLVDCLRYWVEEMRVDGFRFDLAVTLGRTEAGFRSDAPFFREVADDPVVSSVKLIAEPWDLGTDGYQLGHFPADWLHWDDRFRDAARTAWRGDQGSGLDLRHAFDGGPETPETRRPPNTTSVHFVTCHDGFTLEDLVSYEQKHNWANQEENRDGSDHNLSRNWGVEGATDSRLVRLLRDQNKHNLLTTLLLSSGVPMLLYGDERNRTQHGNNNAYCQDNALTRIDWSPDQQAEDMTEFISNLVALRTRLRPLDALQPSSERHWMTATGRPLGPSGISGDQPFGLSVRNPEGTFLVLFNPGTRERLFRLPRAYASVWVRLISTTTGGDGDIASAAYRLGRHSMSVLELRPIEVRPEDPPSSAP